MVPPGETTATVTTAKFMDHSVLCVHDDEGDEDDEDEDEDDDDDDDDDHSHFLKAEQFDAAQWADTVAHI